MVGQLEAGSRSDLVEAGRHWGWTYDVDAEILVVDVGWSFRFTRLADVVDAVLGTVGRAFEQMTACWLEPGPLSGQWQTLLKAQPLRTMMPAGESELSALIRDNGLRSWRQPVVWMGDRSTWGYECLIRAERPDGSVVGAGQLVEWADQENLRFLFDRKCRETHAGALAAASEDLNYLINFQPAVIYQPSVCLATTERLLEKTNLKPHQIIFEVVESDRIEDIPRLKSILNHYREMGYRVALDDFGSAYSGLELLLELVPDVVKIDRGIISQLTGSDVHQAVCKSIVDACHDHGITTLAEGIETEAEFDAVRKLGVEFGQGYLFGRPEAS
ncbi:MAG: EAL domain-containing protein [Xanthomonadales bacterium]|nr:EAL domain-containing protein [Xanthomonadales bacterium]